MVPRRAVYNRVYRRTTVGAGRAWVILLAAGLALALCAHAAGVQKWTDAQGHVHFGDAPAPETHTAPVEIKVQPPSGSGGAPPADDPNAGLLHEYERGHAQELQNKAAARIYGTTPEKPVPNSLTCQGYQDSIERAHQYLRQGHSGEEGNYLHDCVRDLETRYNRECR